jgi:hypothetical protein
MYLAINDAVVNYNAIASEHGLPDLLLDEVIRRCGVTPETFANGADLTPEAEERAKAVLQDIEDRTAALKNEDPDEGLAEGFWRDGGNVWTTVGAGRGAHNAPLCSNIRAVRKVSAGDGLDWAVIVGFKDGRGGDKEVRVSCGDAVTDPSKCIHELASGGLLIHVEDPKLYRLVLKAVVHAAVPLAYRLVKAGWFPIASTHVFALPSGVIPRVKEEVIWGGDRNYCRALQRGSMDRYRRTVVVFADGNGILMACIGMMLASPGIPFLPSSAEVNTIVHLMNTTSLGKTMALRGGASVWGEGSPTTWPTSFLEPWKTTGNASELLLAACNHVGFVLDEMKSFDAKAAASFAYDYALGKGKNRTNPGMTSRSRFAWENFGLSSGEITLTERASDGSIRSQPGDAGAETRVINITPEIIFEVLHGCATAKEAAEKFGVMCIENCGWAGPAYVEWLAFHGDEAHAAIIKNFAVWDAVSARLLGSDPSPQAERVASRLGAPAASAALAAEVLEFPWSAELPVPEADSISAPACAMLKAFLKFLDIWLANHGATVSTQVNQAFGQLRAYYHEAAAGAFIVAGLSTNPVADDKIVRPQSEAVPLRGWKAFRGLLVETDGFGREHYLSGTLEYVDFKPDVLKKHMKWTEVTLRETLRTLRAQGLLLTTKKQKDLKHRRRVDGRLIQVIRVKAGFFGDEDE